MTRSKPAVSAKNPPASSQAGLSGSGHPEADGFIEFWRYAGPAAWFTKNSDFDATLRERFLDLHWSVARCEREQWLDSAYGGLALVLLLDQFPRNAFRGTGHMYATDPLARRYARAAIVAGAVPAVDADLRPFLFLPFMHSELLHDQHYSLELYRAHCPQNLDFALEHCDIIDKFGRFPHRNRELGRSTTPAEQRYLESGGFAG
ncbi:DUF924 family protein [Candidimonas nitroreducens]|uniref:DUF924 domain-containing protein n=1 Tax=Candidimonas nitroreducens TaxID=683354 RepID=A0A225M8I4_9BURK|nr:DUF924 family protein [Candidimonas nitroreducens]OWT57588.1 hypothetical protein CEY11_16995 [Candidimonas nitroreducens]